MPKPPYLHDIEIKPVEELTPGERAWTRPMGPAPNLTKPWTAVVRDERSKEIITVLTSVSMAAVDKIARHWVREHGAGEIVEVPWDRL